MTKRNKHPYLLNYLTLGALLLGGCTGPEDPLDDPSVLADDGSFDAADELESNEQAVPRTAIDGLDFECAELLAPVIARVLPNDIGAYSCWFPNMPSGWTAVPLFSQGSPWMEAQILARPLSIDSPLHRYCKYDYVGQNPEDPIADYEQFFRSGVRHFDGLPATDCPSVTGQGGLNNASVIGASSDAFTDAVDAIDASALASLNLGTVHTYLLDTKQANINAYDHHAEHLRTMLEDLACADGRPGCLSGIHEILVAPLRFEEDFATSHWGVNENVAGGTHGYVHQTALGIAIAVLDWQNRNDDNDPTTLERGVINLSMGAVPSSSYASNSAYATAQAMLDTMRMAACYDMPIFVAAGNRDVADAECDDPGEGLLLPAVYESLVMPTVAECQAWGYVPDWDLSLFPRSILTASDKPLATAVSAVDHQDRLLSTNRLGGTTILAAPALSAVTSGTTPLTGTSVATLVATAGANLLWSAEPGLRSRDMIGVLYNSGWDTGLTAEAGWYTDFPVNRVSLCAALNELVGGLNCSASPPNAAASAAIGTATLTTVAQAQQLNQLVSFVDEDAGSVPVCEQVPLDLMIPQPERPYCATCSVDANTEGGLHTLYMTIEPAIWSEPMTVSSAFLHVTNAADQTSSYQLKAAVVAQINAMNPGTVITVQFAHPSPVSASLKFTYTGTGGPLSVNNPLVVW
jgi:hypothetical protein